MMMNEEQAFHHDSDIAAMDHAAEFLAKLCRLMVEDDALAKKLWPTTKSNVQCWADRINTVTRRWLQEERP